MAVGWVRQIGVRTGRNVALVLLLGGTATACASTGMSLSSTPTRQGYAQRAGPQSGASGRLRGTDKPYEVAGKWYFPHADPNYDQVGTASWYGYPFQARHTADGEIYDEALITAAHKTLPLPCIVEVTNLQNGRSIRVRVNDRGPFVGDRLIDLSKAAAEQLGYDRKGTTQVRVRFITMASPLTAPGLMMASNSPAPARAQAYASQTYASQAYAPQPRAYPDAFDDLDAPAPSPPAPTPVQTAYRAQPTPRDEALAEQDAGPPETFSPQVVQPITATVLSAPSQVAGGGYAVQAGAFATQSSADRAAARLAGAGSAQIVPLQRNGATLYRVVVGAFPDASAAGETRARVMAMGFTDARVVDAY